MPFIQIDRTAATEEVARLLLTNGDREALGIEQNREGKLFFGTKSFCFRVEEQVIGQSTVLLPIEVDQTIKEMLPVKLQWSEDGQHLVVGPLIGILSWPPISGKKPPFGAQNLTFKELCCKAGLMGLLVNIFYPHQINWLEGTVKGFVYTSTSGWLEVETPLPQVIWNRIPTRAIEKMTIVNKFKERLKSEHDVTLFNPGFLDKWDTYCLLEDVPEIKKYLPETQLCENLKIILPQLQAHGGVYLKPTASSVGKGIFRITYDGRLFKCWGQTKDGSEVFATLNWSLAEKWLAARLSNQSYIVQQLISLAKHHNHIFDLRVLAQKTENFTWKMMGAGARVAGQACIVTHIPNGGRKANGMGLLSQVFGRVHARKILQEIEYATVAMAIRLEEVTGQTFAELSFDVAVDEGGNIYVLEINSKPFRFDEDAIRDLAQINLLKFASRLACTINSQ